MIKFRYKRKDPAEVSGSTTTAAKTTSVVKQTKLQPKTSSITTLPKTSRDVKRTVTASGGSQANGVRSVSQKVDDAVQKATPTTLQKASSLQKLGSNSSLQKIGSTSSLQRSRATTPIPVLQKTATRVPIQKTLDGALKTNDAKCQNDCIEDQRAFELSKSAGSKNNTLPRMKNDQKPPIGNPAKRSDPKEYYAIVRLVEELFSQLQFSRERALPADEVRRALAAPFCGQRRFRLGCMADAAECFENILLRLHAHAALPARPDDMCRAPHCLPHRKFAMALVEQGMCSACGATSEPLPFTQMVHYVSASALTTQARQGVGNVPSNGQLSENFGDLLKRAGGMGDVRDCPSSCGAKTQICRSLMNKPEIVSVGVVWDSERPTLEHIMDVFSTIGTTLRLQELFHTVVDHTWANQTVHNLVGVVTYYGKHYSTFFFHTKLRLWIYFDDATVKEVGPRWEQVVEKCRKGRYQPLLLLYSMPNGTPCNLENAPKTNIPYPIVNPGALLSQNALRRSVTPSPEKPIIGNTRRAITPNPDNHIFTQNKPPVHRPYNEYQNLNIIQDNLYGKRSIDEVDNVHVNNEADYISRKTVESVLNAQNAKKQQMQLHRSLSTGSTSANSGDGIVIPEHLNIPRRRDSGNWSGDRNSTSSSSSTTLENPYLYLVGKIQPRNGSLPSSPTRKGELSSGSSSRYDAGYDSYSLSSTDSLPLQQSLKHNLQLAQIPEYQPQIKSPGKSLLAQDDCGKLCMEADQLLDKSKQMEDANNLESALELCNAAASKSRAAMDAPYNNPHMMAFARMKHNTCVMRARSLHRRILQDQGFYDKDSNAPDIRHIREGSNSSARHSRQNSRDKTNHSRQNSKEMLATTIPAVEKICPNNKNIEIYATLPKKKSSIKKSPQPTNAIEDEEYMIYDRPNRESRSIFGRSKNKDEEKNKEKRSRSEDRSKTSKEMSLAPENHIKENLKKDKTKEDKDDKKGDKDGKPSKKQHKIRRKLLMGGLIRRKNRSMPDLTEGNVDDGNKSLIDIKPLSSVDDSALGLKGMDKNLSGMSGYLSEGHLEYSGGGSTNPNLERSKLMRKSFHGSAGKMLTAAKVPPPPPLRTTSQLSKQGDESYDHIERPQYPLPSEMQNGGFYQNYNHNQEKSQSIDNSFDHEPQSLPFLPSYNENGSNKNPSLVNYMQNQKQNQCYNQSIIYDSCNDGNTQSINGYQTVVTKADIHQERTPVKQEPINLFPITHVQNSIPPNTIDDGVDEVDCAIVRMSNLELPPYPSPPSSSLHSRQASEEFPPPPPPLDNNVVQDERSNTTNEEKSSNCLNEILPPNTGLLAQLQQKRQQILNSETKQNYVEESTRSTGETWLRELQAKQAALRLKKSNTHETHKIQASTELNPQFNAYQPVNGLFTKKNNLEGENINVVKNLASKFELVKNKISIAENVQSPKQSEKPSVYNTQNESKINISKISSNPQQLSFETMNTYIVDNYPGSRRTSESSIDKQQIEEELREVELLNAAVNRQLGQNLLHSCSTDTLNSIESKVDNILRTKKKSVSFCDQVILVATAEDQEDDEYIPNPILERVLKSNLNKTEMTTQPLQIEKPVLKRQDSIESQKSTISSISQNSTIIMDNNVQPEYVKVQNTTSPVYQHVPNIHGNNETTKLMEATPNPSQQHRINAPYQQVSTNTNIQMNPLSTNGYQSSSYPINNFQQQYQRQSQKSPNQLYQTSQMFSNNAHPQQYLHHIQNYPQTPSQQNLIQKSTVNGYISNANNQQQKQNTMYFPVNRTQPAYNSNNVQTSQYSTSPSYTSNMNSPYQHLPTATAHFFQNNESTSNTPNSTYDLDRANVLKYNNNVSNCIKNDSQSSNTSTSSYNLNPNLNQHTIQHISPYQRVPQVNSDNQMNQTNSSVYQRIPQYNNPDFQSHLPQNGPYQRIPNVMSEQSKFYPQYNVQNDKQLQHSHQQLYTSENINTLQSSSPYQTIPSMQNPYLPIIPKQPQKKSVSFEPGTKGGAESPIPKSNSLINNSSAVINPYNHSNGTINQVTNVNSVHMNVNNNNVSVIGKSPCNLCRKKFVHPPSIYCIDCDFYMSRFKPRT